LLEAPSWSAKQRFVLVFCWLRLEIRCKQSIILYNLPYNCSRRVTYSFLSFILDASHRIVVDSFKYFWLTFYRQYLMTIIMICINWVCFMPELVCYYVDFVNVYIFISNYASLTLIVLNCMAWLGLKNNLNVLKRLKSAYIKCVKHSLVAIVVIDLILCSLNLVYLHLTLFFSLQLQS